jgi:hypothetical protein
MISAAAAIGATNIIANAKEPAAVMVPASAHEVGIAVDHNPPPVQP